LLRIGGIDARLTWLLLLLFRAVSPAFLSLLFVGPLFFSLLVTFLSFLTLLTLLLLTLLLLTLFLLTLFLLTLLLLPLLLLVLILPVLLLLLPSSILPVFLLSPLGRLLFGKALLRLFEIEPGFRIITSGESRLICLNRLVILSRLEPGVSEVVQGIRNKPRRRNRTRGDTFEFAGSFVESPCMIGNDTEIVCNTWFRGIVEPGALKRRRSRFETADAQGRKSIIHVPTSPAFGHTGYRENGNKHGNIYIIKFYISHSRFSQ